MVMLNPEIVKQSGEYETEESCLSLLGGPRKTKRYQKIKVQYQTLEFQTRLKTFTGWTAQIVQRHFIYLFRSCMLRLSSMRSTIGMGF